MKVSIGILARYQKIFSEAIKYPMKFKTALTIEEFLRKSDEVVKAKMQEFGFDEKKKNLIDQLNKEIEERFEKESNEKTIDNPEELKKRIAKEISDTKAAQEEKKINEEFNELEVEIEPIKYVLDESLPGLFNISMKDDTSGIVIFRQRNV